jgi:predicted dinucleotide-binding enzyme
MKIGIIGAGNIGGTLARKLVAAGHAVKLSGSEGPEEIREQAKKIGATAVASADAVKDVDAIIVSIPTASIPDISALFADVPASVCVIDTSNYYPMRDQKIVDIEEGKPESVWTREQLGRPVVKAFNAALAHTLAEKGLLQGTPGRLAMPVAGDDTSSKTIVKQLVEAVGFDPVDAGTLAESWRQQPGTPAYCTELAAGELRQALATADKDRAPTNRDAVMKEFMEASTPPTHERVIERNRAISAPQ